MPRLGFPTPYDNLDVFCVFDFWLRVSESVSSLSLKLPEAEPSLAGQTPAPTVNPPEKEHRHKCRQSFSSLFVKNRIIVVAFILIVVVGIF